MEELLLAAGAVSVTLQDNEDQPILEPGVGETPLWQSVKLTALFDNDDQQQVLIDRLFQSYCDSGLNQQGIDTHTFSRHISFEELEDKDWEREWLNHFEPVRCGERLWICPSWGEPPDKQAINLMLDPGLAFGTGTHETTLLCLQWLDQHRLTNKNGLDCGCGAGILGIAALLLGANNVCFVDNDPQALRATQDNLLKNAVDASRYSIVAAEEYRSDTQPAFDLVLANILAQPLINLAPILTQSLKRNGWLTLSGLQTPQKNSVRQAYQPNILFAEAAEQNNWLRLSGQRV